MPHPSRVAALSLLAVLAGAAPAAAGPTVFERVSVSPDGGWFSSENYQDSHAAVTSADASVVAFERSPTTGPRDSSDVWLRDRRTGSTRLLGRRPDGSASTDAAAPAVSGDGRRVAFVSSDPGLDPGARGTGVYVQDVATGETKAVAVPAGMDWTITPSLSGDGERLAFAGVVGDGYSLSESRVYVANLRTGDVARVDGGGDTHTMATDPVLSADGRVAAFVTADPLLEADANNAPDIYARDLERGTVERISLDPAGRELPDGLVAGNWSETVEPHLTVSADGQVIGFVVAEGPPDPWRNLTNHVWVRDRVADTTTRLSAGAPAGEGSEHPTMSADGRWVAFQTSAGVALLGGYGHRLAIADRVCHTLAPADVGYVGANWTREPALSADARHLAYTVYDWVSPLVDDTNDSADIVLVDRDPHADCSGYRARVLEDRPAGYWRLEPPRLRAQTEGPDALLRGHYSEVDAPDGSMAPAVEFNRTSRGDRSWAYLGTGFGFAGRRPFTLEAWVRPRYLDEQTSRIVSRERAHAGYLLGASASGVAFSRAADGRATTVRAPLPVGRWSAVTAVYDGTTMSLYVNGRPAARGVSTIELPDVAAPATLGSLEGRWRFFAGAIAEPAIYPHALTPAQVAAHIDPVELGP